jgi:transposase
MNRVCSIFAQLLQLFPREKFLQAVSEHEGDRHARGFSCWGQFVAMLFCQLGQAKSLREICNGLMAIEGKLKHLGIGSAPNKSTLAYANEHRPWEVYRSVFEQLLGQCYSLAQGKKKFRFKNKLLSLDSTSIDLCASMFDWAKYKRTKGAVKVHLLLDNEGYLPCFACLTDGKSHDITAARKIQFQPGTIVVMDKGYVHYDWWKQLSQQGVYFVTRLKKDLKWKELEQRPVPQNSAMLRDQIIEIRPHRRNYALKLRVVTKWDEQKQEEIQFLTNHLEFGTTTIARIYKERWQIEIFFKSLKQLLRVKTFVGTSANALKTQIWTALIAMLILKYLKLRSSFGWSLSNLVALLRQQLFVYRDLFQWLDDPFQAPPILAGVHDVQLQLIW